MRAASLFVRGRPLNRSARFGYQRNPALALNEWRKETRRQDGN
jgi:hypothetical protein